MLLLALLLTFSIGFLPGLFVQLSIYKFGGRCSLAMVLVVSLGTAIAYGRHTVTHKLC
jgi:hypothetical protein